MRRTTCLRRDCGRCGLPPRRRSLHFVHPPPLSDPLFLLSYKSQFVYLYIIHTLSWHIFSVGPFTPVRHDPECKDPAVNHYELQPVNNRENHVYGKQR